MLKDEETPRTDPKVGRMVTLAPPEEKWEELEEIVLRPGAEEEGGPGPP